MKQKHNTESGPLYFQINRHWSCQAVLSVRVLSQHQFPGFAQTSDTRRQSPVEADIWINRPKLMTDSPHIEWCKGLICEISKIKMLGYTVFSSRYSSFLHEYLLHSLPHATHFFKHNTKSKTIFPINYISRGTVLVRSLWFGKLRYSSLS